MDWLKIIASGLGLVDFWSKYFGKKADQETGAKLQQGATDAATLHELLEISRPATSDESDKLWEWNKAKYAESASAGKWFGGQ